MEEGHKGAPTHTL